MLKEKTKNFLERYGSDTKSDSIKRLALEEELNNNPDILEDLSTHLSSLFLQTEENLIPPPSTLSASNKLYKNFLNKYDLNQFLRLSIACQNQSLPFHQIQTKQRENALFDTFMNESLSFLNENFSLPEDFEQTEEGVKRFLSTLDIDVEYDRLGLKVDNLSSYGNLLEEESEQNNQLPDVPLYDYNDNIPTIDNLSSQQQQIEKTVTSQIESFFMESLSQLFEQITKGTCEDQDSIFIDVSLPQDSVQKEQKKRYGGNSELLSDLLQDSVNIMSIGEICSLLKGNGSEQTFVLLKNLINFRYPQFSNLLKNREDLIEQFVLLSNVIDIELCEAIVGTSGQFGFCQDDDREELRSCILSQSGFDNGQVDEILKQINETNKRNQDLLFELLSRESVKEEDVTRLCDINPELEQFDEVKKDFGNTISSILSGILSTVGISYDQSIRSFSKRLVKEQNISQQEKNNKNVPLITDKIIDDLRKQYNSSFSTVEYKSSSNQLRNMIEGSLSGDEEQNKYLDGNVVDNMAKEGLFGANKKTVVQPDQRERLEQGDFIKSDNKKIYFELPKTENVNTAKVFQNKLPSSLLSKDEENIFEYSSIAVKDNQNELYKINKSLIGRLETKIKSESFLDIKEDGCQIYKIYLPIVFGLAESSEFWKASPIHSQPLFPDYNRVRKWYYPHLTPMDKSLAGLNLFGDLSKYKQMANNIVKSKEDSHKETLLKKQLNRFYPFVVNSLSTVKNIQLGGLTQKVSEQDLYREFYDKEGIRETINELNSNLIFAVLEKYWFEELWSKMKVAYYYKVYESGEAFLVKIDQNEKIHSSIENDNLYGGPKMNIEDYISYNCLNIGQSNWEQNRLYAKFPISIRNIAINPLKSCGGLNASVINDSISKGSYVTKGVINFGRGLPANEKARSVSWFSSQQSIRSERFQNGKLLPFFTNSNITKDSTKQQLEQSIFQKSTKDKIQNNKDTDQQSLLQNFNQKGLLPISFHPQTGKMLVDILGIPSEDSISTPLQIRNILDVGEDPLSSFEAQGSSNFPQKNGISQEIFYNLKTRDERYDEIKLVDVDYDKKYESGYKKGTKDITSSPGKWESESQGEDHITKLSNEKNTDNILSYIWSNMIIESLQDRSTLSQMSIDKIRNFYTKENGYEKVKIDLQKRLSNYVSSSPLFQTQETTNDETGKFSIEEEGVIRGLNETNLIDMINFSPKSFSLQNNCDVDLDLMRLSEIKRNAIARYDKISQCIVKGDDGQKRIETVLYNSIIDIIVRLYCIEVVLNGIFLFSRLDLSVDEIDNMLVEHVKKSIEDGIEEEGKKRGYVSLQDDFYEILAANYQDDNDIERLDISCEQVQKQKIKKELSLASNRLKRMIYKPSVIEKEEFDQKDVFQQYLFPFVDLPLSDRIYKNNGGRFLDGSDSFKDPLRKKETTKTFVGFDAQEKRRKNYDPSKSGFFFEKYVRPTYKRKPQDRVLHDYVSLKAFEDYLSSQVKTGDENLSEFFNGLEVGMRLSYRPSKSEHDFLKSIVLSEIQSDINYESKDYYEPGRLIEDADFYVLKQVITGKYIPNPRQNQIVQNPVDIKFTLFWKVESDESLQVVKKFLNTKKWNTDLLTKQNERDSHIYVEVNHGRMFKGSFDDFINNFDKTSNTGRKDIVGYLEGIYNNTLTSTKTLQEFLHGLHYPPTLPPQKYRKQTRLGESLLLPLSQRTKLLDLNSKISDFSTIIEDEEVVNVAQGEGYCDNLPPKLNNNVRKIIIEFEKEYDKCFADSLKREIQTEDKIKLLFQEVFSYNELGNLLLFYIMLYNDITTDLSSMFDNVKTNIFTLYENVDNLDNIQYVNSFSNNVGGDVGLLSDEQQSSDGKNRLFDINSIRNSTPYVIQKGLMETFDPNISTSKRIVEVANSYKKEIQEKSKPIFEIVERRNAGESVTQRELSDLEASRWLIDLSNELKNTPDLSIHIPSAFQMISGIIPSPLGFAYLSFESILGEDLLKKLENNQKQKSKIEYETGVSLDAAKEFAKNLQENCEE